MDRTTTLSPHPDRFKPTMTSLEQVDFINAHRQELASACGAAFPSKGFAKLEHKDFLEKVTVVLGPETSAEFSADLPDRYGRPRAGYRFPKREACLMAMSYSYELQAKVFDRMTALEAKPAFALPDFSNPAAAARAWADAIEATQALAIERDHAIETKAQIGNRREATAMATASTARKETAKLKDLLGFSARHATILQVEDALKGDFNFLPLRNWCKAMEVTPETVPDKRYPKGVKAWPAGAWAAVYGIDLVKLFAQRIPGTVASMEAETGRS
jgi:hypothetical protein